MVTVLWDVRVFTQLHGQGKEAGGVRDPISPISLLLKTSLVGTDRGTSPSSHGSQVTGLRHMANCLSPRATLPWKPPGQPLPFLGPADDPAVGK